MNCKHVQELLPLYVGRDLEENRAKLVTAHVQACVECANSADQYRETRQLLQLFAPPPFGEAVYTGIRQRVLREIGRESTAPTLPQLFASLFRPRIRWAVATVLLVAVSVFVFYFIANRRSNLINDRQQLAGSRRTADRTTPDEQPNAGSQGRESAVSLTSTGRNKDADTPITRSVDRTRQSQRRKSFGAAVARTRSVALSTPDTRTMTAKASPEGNNPAEPDAVPARDPATSDKPLRVDMQTKDRNIRIIWFSPQRTKQDSPSKSSEGI